jgi:hypothetical protein
METEYGTIIISIVSAVILGFAFWVISKITNI